MESRRFFFLAQVGVHSRGIFLLPAKKKWSKNFLTPLIRGGKPKVAIQYLRSYEKIGTAEIQIVSPFLWKCKQSPGRVEVSHQCLVRGWGINKYLKVKIDGLPIPKGRLVKGPYKSICRDCAIYFSTTVYYYAR